MVPKSPRALATRVFLVSRFDSSLSLRDLTYRRHSQTFAVPKTARRAKPFIDHVINFSIVDGKIWFRNYQVRASHLLPTDNGDRAQKTHPVLLLLLLLAPCPFVFRCTRTQILNTPSADALASTSSSSSALTDSQAQNLAKKNNLPHLSLSEVGPRFVLNPVKIFEGSFNGACLYENKGEFAFFFFLSWRTKARKVKPETLPAHSLAHSPRAQSLSPRRNGTRARNSPAQSSTADGRTNKPSVKSGGKDCTSARRTTRSRSGACLLDLSLPLHRLSLSLAPFPSPSAISCGCWSVRAAAARARESEKLYNHYPSKGFLLFQTESLACNSRSISESICFSYGVSSVAKEREREGARYREDLPWRQRAEKIGGIVGITAKYRREDKQKKACRRGSSVWVEGPSR